MKELTISEATLDRLETASNMEDVARILSEEGIDINQLPLTGGSAADGDELDEIALDNVAGGISWNQFKSNLMRTLRSISGPLGRIR